MQTLLLVEDEPRLLEAFREIFEREGYRVLTANSGEAAIDACNAHLGGIDILVSDVVVGEIDGFTVAAIVRSLHQNVAVVLMSGTATPPISRCGSDYEFIQKPFTLQLLLNAVIRSSGRKVHEMSAV